jgi:predicted NACHT family NTPase
MADRNVLERSLSHKNHETLRPRPFSAFADRSNLVLLGDPGAGKTHLFQEAASASGGRYLTARHFLLAPLTSTDTPLFIDGLDETRSGRGDQDAINSFVQKLFAIVPPKVRIACREADWLGDTDRAAFNIYFQEHGGITELQLRALSPAERLSVLTAERSDGVAATAAEAINFLDQAARRGLEEFTLNPQNLLMLWDAVRSRSVWPKTRKELFELSTSLLLSEHNRTKQRSGVGVFTPEELRDAAGAVCAMRLVSDVDGISLQEIGNGWSFRATDLFPLFHLRRRLPLWEDASL